MCVPGGPHHLQELRLHTVGHFILRSPVRERVVFPQVGLYVSLRPLWGLCLRGSALGISLCFFLWVPFFLVVGMPDLCCGPYLYVLLRLFMFSCFLENTSTLCGMPLGN